MDEEGYSVEFTATARRSMHRLPGKIAGACLEFLAGPVAREPYRVGKPLQRELTGQYAARRGSYRVVYVIDDVRRTVVVTRVDSRADVYRPS